MSQYGPPEGGGLPPAFLQLLHRPPNLQRMGGHGVSAGSFRQAHRGFRGHLPPTFPGDQVQQGNGLIMDGETRQSNGFPSEVVNMLHQLLQSEGGGTASNLGELLRQMVAQHAEQAQLAQHVRNPRADY